VTKVVIEIQVYDKGAPEKDWCKFFTELIIEGGVEYGYWYIKPDWFTMTCRMEGDKNEGVLA